MSGVAKGAGGADGTREPTAIRSDSLTNRQRYAQRSNGGDLPNRSRSVAPAGDAGVAISNAAGPLTHGWADGSMSLESAILAQTRSRVGRPTQVLLSVGPTAEREKMLAAFELIPNFEVTTIKGLDFNSIDGAHRADYLIVWFEGLQKLRETDANALVKLSRRARVIVALSSDRLLEAASTLHLADAWLFTDMVLDQIGMLVGLSDSGYTIVPSRVGNDFGLDNLRCQLMHKLDDSERQVLEQLGVGNSNRDISERLEISEPQTKAIVRNILSKLHFRNRTEAAVFMARRQTAQPEPV